jgi:hypothetical protein
MACNRDIFTLPYLFAGVEGQFCVLLSSGIDGGQWSFSLSGRFTYRKRRNRYAVLWAPQRIWQHCGEVRSPLRTSLEADLILITVPKFHLVAVHISICILNFVNPFVAGKAG